LKAIAVATGLKGLRSLRNFSVQFLSSGAEKRLSEAVDWRDVIGILETRVSATRHWYSLVCGDREVQSSFLAIRYGSARSSLSADEALPVIATFGRFDLMN
jgi:hypothetical protein